MAKDYTYRVGVDESGAIKGLTAIQREAKKSLGDTQDELDKTKSRAEVFADAMRTMADRAETEMRDVESAAEALGQALGPDLAAKVGQSGLERIVEDMRKAGLTAEDIKADVDNLADGVKRLHDVSEQAAAKVATTVPAMDGASDSAIRLRDESDKTGSVMANTMGNAAQDLAGSFGLANVAGGTLGVTIGQLAEYAAEGDIGLRNLAKQAGPMLAVTAAVAGIGAAIARHKAEQAEFREAVDATKESLAELGATAPQVLFLAEALEALRSPGDAANTELGELGEVAKRAGLDVGDLARAVAGGEQTTRAWFEAQADAAGISREFARALQIGGVNVEGYTNLTRGQQRALGDLYNTFVEADDAARVNDEAIRANSEAVKGLLGDTKALDAFLQSMAPAPLEEKIPPDILREIANELERGGTGAETMGKHAAELGGIIGPLGADALPALVEAARDAATETEDLGDEMSSAEKMARNLKRAWDDLKGDLSIEEQALAIEDGFDRVEQAGVEAYAAQASGAADAEAKARAYREEQIRLEQQIIDYATQVRGIPPSVVTQVQALIDEGKLAEAEAMVEEWRTRTRTIKVGVVVTGTDGLPKIVGLDTPGPKGPGNADGGPTFPGVFHPVVERGMPEILSEGSRRYLLSPNGGQVSPLTGGLGGDVYNFYVQGHVLTERQLGDVVHEALLAKQRRGTALGFRQS